MDQGTKPRGTKLNAKKTKHKPQEPQSEDSDDQSEQSEESDLNSRSDESDGEEKQSSGESDEDQSSEESDEDQLSEESDEDQSSEEIEDEEEYQSSEESDEDQSSEGSDSEEVNHSSKGSEDKEEEEQSSEGSDSEEDNQLSEESDEYQSSKGSEDDEEEDQSSEGSEDDEEEDQSSEGSEGSDSEEDEQTTDEESNPNGEQDSESEDEDGDGESSEESSSEPEQQSPKEHQPQRRSGQCSSQNPEESRRKDLDNQTQQHNRSPSKHQKSKGKTPSPAKPAKKLGRKHDIPKQKGTPPQSTTEAKKPPTPRIVTDIRHARGEKGIAKQAGKPKTEQERTTKRPKFEEERRPPRTREDRGYHNTESFRTRRKDIRESNTDEGRAPGATSREGREYDSGGVYRTLSKQDIRESNAGKRREPRTIDREKHGSKEAYLPGEREVRQNNAAQGFQRGYQEADPMFNGRKNRTKACDMQPYNAGQVRRDRDTNRNSYHPEGQPKPAHKTNRNGDKSGKELHAYDLVEILAKKEDLDSSILQVIREKNVKPADVQMVLKNYASVFHIKSDRFCLKPRLKLCAEHSSSKGCENKTDCVGLHICQNFLKGICKYKVCDLGHNLATGHNKKVLGNSFLDRLGNDTLLRILSKSLPKITSNSQNGSADQRTRHSSPNQEFLETSESDAYSLSEDDDESDANHLHRGSKRKKPSPNKKKRQIQTVWSTDSNGDVEIPEICYNSVEGSCPRQDEGCEKLHSFQHFYWQISKDNSKWFNLLPKLVLCLEKSYCNVSEDGVTLPRLKGVDLQALHIDAVKILSRDEWTSDFQSMTLVNSNHKVQLHLRRLCTEKTDSASVKANTFCWYFRDGNQWVSYDNNEEQGLSNTATSKDIEKHYLAKPSIPFNLKKQRYNYLLDFQKMCQINAVTNTRREIRRRPLEHLQETPHRSFLPEDWQDMQPKERMRLVDLDPKSDEYKKVITLLKDDTYKAKIQKIQRNQNLHLWKAFQLRKEDMITQYGDEASVKMTDLFHGTNPDIVSNICKENFDFRLHGEGTGLNWGKGLYFGNDITNCYNNCSPDTAGLKYLFVAKVLVGTITLGNKDLKRPPLNPATGALFDTTVDNDTQPTIFVKYDRQEYYPYYLITMI